MNKPSIQNAIPHTPKGNITVTGSNYGSERTAVLPVDPYNDFLSDGGKLWPHPRDVARSLGLHDKLRAITGAARKAGIRIVYVPHHRAEPGDFESRDHPNPDQVGTARIQASAKDSRGGEWHPDFAPQPSDVTAKEHWAQTHAAHVLNGPNFAHAILTTAELVAALSPD